MTDPSTPEKGWLNKVMRDVAEEVNELPTLRALVEAQRKRLIEAEAHLNSIKSYATEAAKTPITRESIQVAPDTRDLRMIAYTQFDELQGFCRLVLSEIGGDQ